MLSPAPAIIFPFRWIMPSITYPSPHSTGIMESYIPTRPSSDLHRRISARKKPPPAMENQHRALPGPARRDRQRSSSFSALSQTLSRLMPNNRPEKGGTARPMDSGSKDGDMPSSPKTIVEIFSRRGRANEREDEGEEMRRTKSWSPKKIAMTADDADEDDHRPSKPKKLSTLKTLWDLHQAVKVDDGIDDFSQHPDRLRSDARELRRAEPKTPDSTFTIQQTTANDAIPVVSAIQESAAVLKSSQHIYEEKKARREERRSFRESDDFIGVQDINPRTGYPDPSSVTSSSGGDIISESTRRKLQEDEQRMASASKEYQAALERRENALQKLEIERERKRREKKERAEKKMAQLRARVRKDGRWKNDGNTWSMVSEPGLSPIVQSVAGTPTCETAPHRFLMTPITKKDSVARLNTRMEGNYLQQEPPHPKTPTRYRIPYAESASNAPKSQKDLSHRIRTPTEKIKQSILPLNADCLYGNILGTPTRSDQTMTLPIQRKEVGSAILHRRASSSETVIHMIEIDQSLPIELPDSSVLAISINSPSVNPQVKVTTPGETTHTLSLISPPVGEEPFLDVPRVPVENEGVQGNEAIVTSHQSALMNQALTGLPLLQNPKDTSQANCIHSLQDPPPMILKDPISARLPSNLQSQWIPISTVWKSIPTFSEQGPGNQVLSTITPIITITGSMGAPCPLNQLDGFKDDSEDQVSPKCLTIANSKIRTANSHTKEMTNGMPSSGSPMNQADIATSSAHHLPTLSTPTKRPIPRLCQPVSSDPAKPGPRSTLTFISTSPQRQRLSQQSTAQNAAQAAFPRASSQRLGKEVRTRSSSLASPKTKSKEAGQGRKIFSKGNVDTGDLFSTPVDLERNPQLLRKRVEQAKQLGGPSSNGGEDGFIVCCADVEKRVRFANDQPPAGQKKISQSSPYKRLKDPQSMPSKKPKASREVIVKVSMIRKLYEMVMWAIGVAWWFVSPVFNPRSGLRWGWRRNELTWRDILLIGAAGTFGGGVFLVMVLLARIVKVALRIVNWCIKVCKVLASFWRRFMD